MLHSLVTRNNNSPGHPVFAHHRYWDDAMPDTATGATLNGSVGAGERLRSWRCFRENLLGGRRKIVHVAEKCHRLPNLLYS